MSHASRIATLLEDVQEVSKEAAKRKEIPGLPKGWRTTRYSAREQEASWSPGSGHEYRISSRDGGRSWRIDYFAPGARTGEKIPRKKENSPHGFHAADEAVNHWKAVQKGKTGADMSHASRIATLLEDVQGLTDKLAAKKAPGIIATAYRLSDEASHKIKYYLQNNKDIDARAKYDLKEADKHFAQGRNSINKAVKVLED